MSKDINLLRSLIREHLNEADEGEVAGYTIAISGTATLVESLNLLTGRRDIT